MSLKAAASAARSSLPRTCIRSCRRPDGEALGDGGGDPDGPDHLAGSPAPPPPRAARPAGCRSAGPCCGPGRPSAAPPAAGRGSRARRSPAAGSPDAPTTRPFVDPVRRTTAPGRRCRRSGRCSTSRRSSCGTSSTSASPDTKGSELPEMTTMEKTPAAVPRSATACCTALRVRLMLELSSRGAAASWRWAMLTPLRNSACAAFRLPSSTPAVMLPMESRPTTKTTSPDSRTVVAATRSCSEVRHRSAAQRAPSTVARRVAGHQRPMLMPRPRRGGESAPAVSSSGPGASPFCSAGSRLASTCGRSESGPTGRRRPGS